MAHGLDQFAAHLKHLEGGLGDFEPVPYYEPKTDSLIYFIRDESSYAERLTRFCTLHLSNRDDTLVGIEVKGLRTITKAVQGLALNQDIDIIEPISVKGEDGEYFDLAVVVRQALVPNHEPVTGERYSELERAIRGVRINKSEFCDA